MTIDNNFSLDSVLFIIRRRWRAMILAFIFSILVALAMAFLSPVSYKSTGTISVEAARIAPDVVQTHEVMNYANERVDSIRRRVMSKDSLLRIIKKYGLYPNIKDSKEAVTALSKRILFELQTRDKSAADWSSEKVVIAFSVGYEDASPEVAHKVANELVTLFLDENVKVRNQRATETTEFLTSELEHLKADLDATESKVAAYKQAHSGALPENMQLHMGMLQNLEQNLKEVDRDYKSTQEELRHLDVELTNAQTSVPITSGIGGGDAATELEKAKAELERDLGLYKETHPTIRALKRKIELLEQAAAGQQPKPKQSLATDLATSKIQRQIDTANVRLNSLADQKRSLQAQLLQLQSQVSQTPAVERGLFALMRDYENAKAKYDEMKSKQVNAKIAQNMEQENKGDHFLLLEAPEFPEKRFKPIRRQILGMGFVLGLLAAIGVGFLFETLDGRVRGVENLASVANVRPMTVIPYINTQNEVLRTQVLVKSAVTAGAVILVSALLLAVYTMVR